MTTVYAAHYNGPVYASSGSHTMEQVEAAPPPAEEQYITTFFCRALYDYQTNDASSLSFRKGDIIEVLTRLDSGWWDGLLGPDERGWFPSNYVTIISDQEAEAALSASDSEAPQSVLRDNRVVEMAHSMTSTLSSTSMTNMSRALSQSDREGDWLDRDPDYAPPSYSQASDVEDYYSDASIVSQNRDPTQTHDFWVPRVSSDGRVRTFCTNQLMISLTYMSLFTRYFTSTRRQASNQLTYLKKLQTIPKLTSPYIRGKIACGREHMDWRREQALVFLRDQERLNPG
jgi:son of sevenless